MIKFEWDETKAAANIKKHQVSFDEAKSIFSTSSVFSSSMTSTRPVKSVF